MRTQAGVIPSPCSLQLTLSFWRGNGKEENAVFSCDLLAYASTVTSTETVKTESGRKQLDNLLYLSFLFQCICAQWCNY